MDNSYTRAEIEVLIFEAEDIITTSGGSGDSSKDETETIIPS